MTLLRRIVALLAVLLVLAACSNDSTGQSERGDSAAGGGAGVQDGGGAPAPEPGGGEAGGGQDSGDEDAGGDLGGGAVADEDRQYVVTASMTVVVDDAREAADDAVEIVEAADGRVQNRAEYDAGEAPSAYLVLRVPSDALTDTIERIEALGDRRDLTVTEDDVTRTSRDLDARIRALQLSVDRLLGMLAEAGTTEALITAESTLADRQAELESLQSQRALLAEQVEMATLELDLLSESAPSLEPGGFLGGLRTGWESLVTFAGAVLVVVGVLLPWLVILGAVTAVVLLLMRRRARSHPRPPRPTTPEPVRPFATAAVPGPATGGATPPTEQPRPPASEA